MILTFVPPSNKTSSTMFFPTYIWIIAIWLFTSITIMLISECVSITVVTLGSDITLIIILGFFGFNFCHIYFLRSGAIFNN